jgi:predicted RNA-binding protein with TRAM domain
MHLDHFVVLGEGKLADLAPAAPVAEDGELQVELVEVDRHDGAAGVGKVDGFDVCVADGAHLVGKRVKVHVERVLDGAAYATLVRRTKKAVEPLTAEAEAEKPTRKPPARKDAEAVVELAEGVVETAETAETAEAVVEADGDTPAPVKKKTRRGSRGGKNRKKPAAAVDGEAAPEPELEAEPERDAEPEAEQTVTIHLPADDLGRKADRDGDGEPEPAAAPEVETEVEPEPAAENGAAQAKKKTRRGSRGGKNRRKRTEASGNGAEPDGAVETAEAEPAENGAPDEEWGYVPMSEWGDEFER